MLSQKSKTKEKSKMSFANHIAFGALVSGTKIVLSGATLESQIILVALLGCLLPDIDNTNSLLGSSLKSISSYIINNHGHRTITHSFLTLFALYLLAGSFEFFYTKRIYLADFFAINYASHIVLDMFTIEGVEAMYPISRSRFVFIGNKNYRLQAGNKRHELLLFLALAFCSTGTWNFYRQDIKTLFMSKIQTIVGLHNVANLDSRATKVNFCYFKDSIEYRGIGLLIESSQSRLVIFENSSKLFHTIDSSCSIRELAYSKESKNMQHLEIKEQNITIERLNQLTKGRIILELNIISQMPISYQHKVLGKNFQLKNVYSPSFVIQQSHDEDEFSELKKTQMRLKQIEELIPLSSIIEKESLAKELKELKRKEAHLSGKIKKERSSSHILVEMKVVECEGIIEKE